MNDYAIVQRRLFIRQPWYERLRRALRRLSFGWIK